MIFVITEIVCITTGTSSTLRKNRSESPSSIVSHPELCSDPPFGSDWERGVTSTALTIEQEVDDARSIRDTGVSDKKRGSQASSSGSRKKQRTSGPRGFQGWNRDQ